MGIQNSFGCDPRTQIRLLPESAEKLIFLKYNLRAIGFKSVSLPVVRESVCSVDRSISATSDAAALLSNDSDYVDSDSDEYRGVDDRYITVLAAMVLELSTIFGLRDYPGLSLKKLWSQSNVNSQSANRTEAFFCLNKSQCASEDTSNCSWTWSSSR